MGRYIKPGDPLPDTDPLYPPANEARCALVSRPAPSENPIIRELQKKSGATGEVAG